MKNLLKTVAIVILVSLFASCGLFKPPFAPSNMNEGEGARNKQVEKQENQKVKEQNDKQ